MADIYVKPNWSELPNELLQSILEKINDDVDILWFKAVCCSWKIAANSYVTSPFYSPLSQSTPWIIYPGDNDNDDNDDETAASSCRFFNLAEKTYKMNKMLEEKTDYVVGTSYGWLVISNRSGKKLKLFNPFSRPHKKIELPELTIPGAIPGRNSFTISKAILLSEPSLTKAFGIVVSTFDPLRRLAIYVHGNSNSSSKWTEFGDLQSYIDIICHNNMLYALNLDGSVEVWHFPNYTRIPNKFMTKVYCPCLHCLYPCGLVESLGEVLVIMMRLIYDTPFEIKNVHFYVYKLDCSGKRWEKVESLRDRVLFLSGNSKTRIGISAKSSSECEENSIYFMCDSGFFGSTAWGKNVVEYGVYKFEEKTVKPFKQRSIIEGHFTPLWIVPKLW